MKRISTECSMCHKPLEIYPCKIKKHNFCCRKCASDFTSKSKNPDHYKESRNLEAVSKAMSETNRRLNSTRMNDQTKEKIRQSRLKFRNENGGYYKLYGRHIHRIIAEEKLGRPLEKGEIVHHIDGNIHNNDKDNLLILKNQSEHAKLHAKLRCDKRKKVV